MHESKSQILAGDRSVGSGRDARGHIRFRCPHPGYPVILSICWEWVRHCPEQSLCRHLWNTPRISWNCRIWRLYSACLCGNALRPRYALVSVRAVGLEPPVGLRHGVFRLPGAGGNPCGLLPMHVLRSPERRAGDHDRLRH